MDERSPGKAHNYKNKNQAKLSEKIKLHVTAAAVAAATVDDDAATAADVSNSVYLNKSRGML